MKIGAIRKTISCVDSKAYIGKRLLCTFEFTRYSYFGSGKLSRLAIAAHAVYTILAAVMQYFQFFKFYYWAGTIRCAS